MAMIAYKVPAARVYVVDANEKRISAWNSEHLPIYEPGLEEIVLRARGRNLFFSTDVAGAIRAAGIIFVAVNTPTKAYGAGIGRAADLRFIEAVARTIAMYSDGPKIIVEKSTVPVRTAEMIKEILCANSRGHRFEVLSNPEFLAEGSAIADLQVPDRVLIGGEPTPSGRAAMQDLIALYANWVPRDKIITSNLWSSELSKLVANAFLAQRISSINAVSALCEATGADVDEVARAVGADSRIGPKFLKASVGFGGSCFQKDILNLVYLCEQFGLQQVAEYWKSVVDINNWQKRRFVAQIIRSLFSSVSGKKIAILGFSFKKNTSDTRESAAIEVCRALLEEHAYVVVYDPKVQAAQIMNDVLDGRDSGKHLQIAESAYDAAIEADAIAILTEWEEFRLLNYSAILARMRKPAFLFDGRNILDLEELERIGFRTVGIGRKRT